MIVMGSAKAFSHFSGLSSVSLLLLLLASPLQVPVPSPRTLGTGLVQREVVWLRSRGGGGSL